MMKKKLFKEFHAKIKGHHEAEEHVLFEDVKEKSDEDGKEIVREMIEEHMDEEEKELFEQARKVLDEKELESKYKPFEDEMKKYKKEKEKALKTNREKAPA
jgi:hemerythrin-like domain-containing protein